MVMHRGHVLLVEDNSLGIKARQFVAQTAEILCGSHKETSFPEAARALVPLLNLSPMLSMLNTRRNELKARVGLFPDKIKWTW